MTFHLWQETVMPFGNSPWFRYLFGWALPPKMSLLKSSHTPETREASIRKQVLDLPRPPMTSHDLP